MSYIFIPASHPSQWEVSPETLPLRRDRYLTSGGSEERTKVGQVNGRWVWWVGYRYVVTYKRARHSFSTYFEASIFCQGL